LESSGLDTLFGLEFSDALWMGKDTLALFKSFWTDYLNILIFSSVMPLIEQEISVFSQNLTISK
jgi:hypothetical protein